jgi:hypothetical protein
MEGGDANQTKMSQEGTSPLLALILLVFLKRQIEQLDLLLNFRITRYKWWTYLSKTDMLFGDDCTFHEADRQMACLWSRKVITSVMVKDFFDVGNLAFFSGTGEGSMGVVFGFLLVVPIVSESNIRPLFLQPIVIYILTTKHQPCLLILPGAVVT